MYRIGIAGSAVQFSIEAHVFGRILLNLGRDWRHPVDDGLGRYEK